MSPAALALALRVGALLSTRAAWAATPADSQARWDTWCAWTRRCDAPAAPLAAFWTAHALHLNVQRYNDWRLRLVLPTRPVARRRTRKAAA